MYTCGGGCPSLPHFSGEAEKSKSCVFLRRITSSSYKVNYVRTTDKKGSAMKDIIVCSPKSLPPELLVRAARTAVEINPHNHPPVEHLTRIIPAFQPTAQRIALLTKKYWGIGGVRLTVSFLDNPPSVLRKR